MANQTKICKKVILADDFFQFYKFSDKIAEIRIFPSKALSYEIQLFIVDLLYFEKSNNLIKTALSFQNLIFPRLIELKMTFYIYYCRFI